MGERERAGQGKRVSKAQRLAAAAEAYFASREGEALRDGAGEALRARNGEPLYARPPRPPTMTGLALALGFTSRQALLAYTGKGAAGKVVERARSRVEAYAEERLYDREGAQGAKLSLINNCPGWRLKAAEEDGQEGRLPELLEAVKQIE